GGARGSRYAGWLALSAPAPAAFASNPTECDQRLQRRTVISRSDPLQVAGRRVAPVAASGGVEIGLSRRGVSGHHVLQLIVRALGGVGDLAVQERGDIGDVRRRQRDRRFVGGLQV